MYFSEKILHFIGSLQFDVPLAAGIEVMHPFENAATIELCQKFYDQYYRDDNTRWMIIGINPGRFGGGVTGIPFTDPIRLEKECGIENSWPKKQELSSVFIYQMINAFGGASSVLQTVLHYGNQPAGFHQGQQKPELL